MPPRKSYGKNIAPVKLQPEISSDDDVEIEIPEIEEEEDDGSGDTGAAWIIFSKTNPLGSGQRPGGVQRAKPQEAPEF